MPIEIPKLVSASELKPVLELGLKIIFVKPGDLSANTAYHDERESHKFTIKIATDEKNFRRLYGTWKTRLLKDQLMTLLHALVHICGKTIWNRPEIWAGRFVSAELNRAIDTEVNDILKNRKQLLEEILLAIFTHPKCSIIYENYEAPFKTLHLKMEKKIARERLNQVAAGKLKFGNPEQIAIVKTARRLRIP